MVGVYLLFLSFLICGFGLFLGELFLIKCVGRYGVFLSGRMLDVVIGGYFTGYLFCLFFIR